MLKDVQNYISHLFSRSINLNSSDRCCYVHVYIKFIFETYKTVISLWAIRETCTAALKGGKLKLFSSPKVEFFRLQNIEVCKKLSHWPSKNTGESYTLFSDFSHVKISTVQLTFHNDTNERKNYRSTYATCKGWKPAAMLTFINVDYLH